MLISLKRLIARLTRFRLIHFLMGIAIRLVVPRRRMGAGVVVFNDKGQILLLNHSFHGSHPWGLPGGWLNRAEEPAAAVLRELREETGLSAELGPVVFLGNTYYRADINAYYMATQPKGTLKLSFEVVEAGWYAPNTLPDGMLPMTYQVINQAIAIYQRLYGSPQGAIPA